MSRIRAENTKPEKAVRRALHGMGYRFRLHRRDLPGSPDIVLPKHRTVVFVHGCFWHRHSGCRLAYVPRSRVAFWMKKFAGTLERDRRALSRLRRESWRALVVWECQTTSHTRLAARLAAKLSRASSGPKATVPAGTS